MEDREKGLRRGKGGEKRRENCVKYGKMRVLGKMKVLGKGWEEIEGKRGKTYQKTRDFPKFLGEIQKISEN